MIKLYALKMVNLTLIVPSVLDIWGAVSLIASCVEMPVRGDGVQQIMCPRDETGHGFSHMDGGWMPPGETEAQCSLVNSKTKKEHAAP